MSEPFQPQGFGALGISAGLLRIIDRIGYSVPTPIQAESIPLGLKGHDMIGIAQTGTGKTLAFAVPMISNLQGNGVGLVLAPTRELAMQIDESFRQLGVRVATLIGGAPIFRQIQQLRSRPHVIVATPGRLMDHMQQRTVDLSRVQVVVLDEADRMLDMGFAPAIRRILETTPSSRQTMLFSATMPREIEDLASRYLLDPHRIEVAQQGTAAADVEQELYVVHKDDKFSLLETLLETHSGTVLVFTRTRHGARKLATHVRNIGHTAAELHSDRSLAQRIAALNGFKRGVYRVLVATDIAARGIDVKDIELVVNFDVPENPEDYVHRIGRTGRAGASGRAITFAMPDQRGNIRSIERLMKKDLPLSKNSKLSYGAQAPQVAQGGGNRDRFRRGPKPAFARTR